MAGLRLVGGTWPAVQGRPARRANLAVPARWVPVRVKFIVLLRVCRVLPAAVGNVSVNSRLSVPPPARVFRPVRFTGDAKLTGREVSTVVAVTLHV